MEVDNVIKGKLFVISGPAGVGKGTLIKKLMNDDSSLQLSISHTTRNKRTGEVDGRDYHFLEKSTFENLMEDGFFIETAVVHGNYYGTAKKEIDEKLHHSNVLLEIDVAGAENIKTKFEHSVLIFIKPPSLEELEKRMITRGTESEESIRTRLETARHELGNNDFFDYLIVNDRIDDSLNQIKKIISGGYDA